MKVSTLTISIQYTAAPEVLVGTTGLRKEKKTVIDLERNKFNCIYR